MKALYVLLAAFAVLVLQTAHAQPSPQLWNWDHCHIPGAAEAFALGDIDFTGSTIDEGDDFLEFSTPVYPALCVMDISYTTKFTHNVQMVGLQMGSSLDVAEEWAMWVDVTLPSGKTFRVPKLQYDKHGADSRGNLNEHYNISWLLPAGSVIRVRRPAVICIGVPFKFVVNPGPGDFHSYDQNNCITGQSVTLVGKL